MLSCAPSPRTIARRTNHFTGPMSAMPTNQALNLHQPPDRQFIKIQCDRDQPMMHPPSEVPFCANCRVLDEEMSKQTNSSSSSGDMKSDLVQADAGLCDRSDDATNGDNNNNNNNNDDEYKDVVADDDESRSWVLKQPPGPWWCEECQDAITLPHITISELFAVLRQWTPYAQLQLHTIVEEIFRRGAHVDDRDSVTDMTLLHFVAKSGALGDEQIAYTIANFLLDAGANIESRSKWTDMTPLHYASYFDCPLLADLLIRRGAQIGARSYLTDNATPLHLAASQLSLGTARILIQAGDLLLTRIGHQFDAKRAKDGLGRTAFECLPPSGQLPEPLCTLRDLLAELLRPTSGQTDSLVYNHDMPSNVSSIVCSMDNQSNITSTLAYPQPSVLTVEENNSTTPITPNATTTTTTDWLVAETGFLSPRTRRSVDPYKTDKSKQSSATNAATVNNGVSSPRSSNKVSISARVTLQSMGLKLGDRVCIGPGNNAVTTPRSSDKLNCAGKTRSRVDVVGRIGKLRFCGPVSFASGVWVGVELDEPLGRNNGTVSGVQYFSCAYQYGIFAPIGRVYKTVQVDGKMNWHPVTHHHSQRPSTPSFIPESTVPNLKRIPASRSSYSLSPTGLQSSVAITATTTTTVSSTWTNCRTANNPSTVTHAPIDISHVTAKVDTGLRVRSPDPHSETAHFQIGDHVLVAGQRKGLLRFIGETQFAPGTWFGIELDHPVGKNNGSVNGVRYFDCAVGHGIFAPINRIQKLPHDPENQLTISSQMSFDVMSNSCQLDGHHANSTSKNWSRTPWSSTTSPMIGRAVIGRPTLPMELMNALKAVGHNPHEVTANEPNFYLTEGLQVLCNGEIGTLRYIGPIVFADGIWLGIELRKPRGRHDGAVAGKRYFHCRSGHGLLVRPARVYCRGINAMKLLPPALVEIELKLAAKRQCQSEQQTNSTG